MSNRWFLTVPLLVLTVSACNPFRREPAVQVSASDALLNTRWHANLASPGSLAGAVQMSGSASMAPGVNGTTTLTIHLANASPGGLHPWAAYWGQCGPGVGSGVLGTNEAYRPLTVGSDGQATATATVPMETPSTGQYFVVVRASEANYETIVACGNFAPPTR